MSLTHKTPFRIVESSKKHALINLRCASGLDRRPGYLCVGTHWFGDDHDCHLHEQAMDPEVVKVTIGAYERIQRYGYTSIDGLRGAKRDAWEGGHRMAFLARGHGHIPAGKVSDETSCHVDLMATCATLLGANLPPDAGGDSYNILPALLGEK